MYLPSYVESNAQISSVDAIKSDTFFVQHRAAINELALGELLFEYS